MVTQAVLTQIVNNSIGTLGLSLDRKCPICEQIVQPVKVNFPGFGEKIVPVACKCETDRLEQEQRQAYLRERNGYLHSYSDDDQMVAGASFDRCTISQGRAKAYQQIRNFADNLSVWKELGLYLYGDNGSGKSYLLTAATHFLRERGHSVIFTTAKSLIQRAKPASTKAEVLSAYKNCDVLIIDELGAAIPAEWEFDDLFHVMNARQGRLPILYGSNFAISELEVRMNDRHAGWGKRLMDRIASDIAEAVHMSGPSERLIKMGQNKRLLERRLNGGE